MKTSTKFFIIVFLITLVGSFLTSNYLFSSISVNGGKISFNFSTISYIALSLTIVNFIVGNVLYLKFLKSRKFSSMLFFSTAPLILTFGVIAYFLSNINNFSGQTFKVVRTALNISETNYNNYLWLVLSVIIVLTVLYITFSLVTKPVKKLEIATKRLSFGEVKDKISLGGNKQFMEIEHSLNKINDTFKKKEKFVNYNLQSSKSISKDFLKFFGKKSAIEFEVGSQIKKSATILFCNIKNTNSFNKNMTIEENYNYTNSYLNVVSPIIKKFGGYIDKYLDDGILSVFVSTSSALSCAIAINKAIKQKNNEQKSLPMLCVGISLHTDEICFGIVGDENKKYPTIISNFLNLTSKMQDINKVYGTKIVVSKQFINSISTGHNFSYRYLANVIFEDESTVEIFECLDIYIKQKRVRLEKYRGEFENGVKAYVNGKYEDAKQIFEKVYQKEKDDKACYAYYNLCCENLGNHILNHE